MRNKFILLSLIILIFFSFVNAAKAETEKEVDYKNSIIVDSDLDGLTDEGEKQIFLTDPGNPDSDSDGILDGAEIVGKSNPLDISNPRTQEIIIPTMKKEIPWAWYILRASALMGFFLLYLSFFFGLSIRTFGLRKFISPVDSYSIHCWISLQALLFALIHIFSLLFDKFLNFSIKDIFIPFFLTPSDNLMQISLFKEAVAFGTISFYLMLALILTSYLRRFIGQTAWRLIHFSNIVLYVFVFMHALYIGTDLKSGIVREIFIWANIILVLIMLLNLISKIILFFKNKQKKDENLRQGDSAVESE